VAVTEGEALPRLPGLDDVGGRVGRVPLVLFFYPKAETSG
jgi:peroxiredoxin